MYFSDKCFCYQEPNSQGGHSGHFSLHLSHQGKRIMFEYDIYLSYLALHHTQVSQLRREWLLFMD